MSDAQGPRGGEREAAAGDADADRREVEVREADALLAVAVEAATTAGALLMERVRHGAESDVSSKSTPTDLVSEADLASERAIRELLARRRPDDGFLGEEGARTEGSSGLSWVVDPLDGTVNFLFGIPQWCVSVAVCDQQGTIAGAVYDPNRDELFTASRGGPALLRSATGTVELRGRQAGPPMVGDGEIGLDSAMVATGLAYDAGVREREAEVLAGMVPRVRDIRRFGSAALDLVWTAAGRYDAYFDRSIKIWDVAAGMLICERAGLEVRELDEASGLPWGVLAAPAGLAGALSELIGA